MNTKMIIKMAWLNIWRNPVRTGVVMSAVVIGIWALVFLLGFFNGMIDSYINATIESRTSHFQIHHPDFVSDPEIVYSLPSHREYLDKLYDDHRVKAATQRLVVQALLSSAAGSRGGIVKGVDPTSERGISALDKKISEGEYLDADRRNPVLISRGMGRRLGVSLNQHVVLSFQNAEGEFASGRFRVVGWYDTGNTQEDDMMAFVRFDDLLDLTLLDEGAFHEMAVLLSDIKDVEQVVADMSKVFPEASVRPYTVISPDMLLYNEQIKTMLTIVIVVVMIALLFGIINTMLMAVLERQRELGMLMAIGMNRIKVFLMITFESLILCTLAAPIGLLIGYLTTTWLGNSGIDLKNWSQGLEQFGIGTLIYPQLEWSTYLEIVFALVVTAIVAGIYPSIKAISLKPVEAIRKL
jgi:putative ABC transport system permease protein